MAPCLMPGHAGGNNQPFAVFQFADDDRIYCGCWSCDFSRGDIFDFKYEDFTLAGYIPHPHITAKVAV